MLTQLTNELYAVGVFPGKNVKYYISSLRFLCSKPPIFVECDLQLPEGNYEILGTCTENDIDFDPAEYLEFKISGKLLGNSKLFLMYGNLPRQFWSFYPDASFRSLLASKGITEFEKLVILKKV